MTKLLGSLTLISLFLAGCSNESSTKIDGSNDSAAVEKLGSNHLLFTYEDVQEAQRKIESASNSLITEAIEDISSYPDCTSIRSIVKISNGKAELTEFSYIDTNNRVLALYQWDDIRGAFKLYGGSILPIIGGCPDGFAFLKLCSYSDFSTCSGTAVGTYTNANLSATGCIEFSWTVGTAAVTVCARKC
ncbi:MAG: hypothetical protein EOO51_12225 [Flavobacterium sp.]|nr:MAG: hypothetical protein EOO51_12225 [Flavobacterium sp.]